MIGAAPNVPESRLHPVPGYRLTVEHMDATTTVSTHESDDWVPHSCTLPTADQPVRVREFDELFARALHGIEQPNPTLLRLTLDASEQSTAADLTARETGCCSFFGFTFGEPSDGQVDLEVTVPDAHADVLAALASRAASLAGSDV